jgi:hypothetical protein
MGHELILAGMLIMAGENLDHKLLATRPRSVRTCLPEALRETLMVHVVTHPAHELR